MTLQPVTIFFIKCFASRQNKNVTELNQTLLRVVVHMMLRPVRCAGFNQTMLC